MRNTADGHAPRRADPGQSDVKAVVVNVENEAVPKMGDAGPSVDSGYVESVGSVRDIASCSCKARSSCTDCWS